MAKQKGISEKYVKKIKAYFSKIKTDDVKRDSKQLPKDSNKS